MKRFLLSSISAILVVILLSVCLSVTILAESLYIKKIVSVVYDDSGSMLNDNSANWAYASYAMQSFCGLMNSGDRLFITYMSAVEKNPELDPPEIDLSTAKIQGSVNTVRTHDDYGNTPFNAIDIAFNKLKSVNDSNSNTQYWLVVITDGIFQVGGNDNVSETELNSTLSSYSNEVMPNGSKPQITYLAIGDNAVKPKQNISSGIYVYSSTGSSDIINVMADIADKVSGRSRLSVKDIVLIDSKTIQITSSIPLLNIAILSQKTSAKIINTQYIKGRNLDIERSVYMKYPESNWWNTDTSLNGGAFLISNNGINIDAGVYTISFDSEISLDNVVVMFEPALEVRMALSINGELIENFSNLNNYSENDKISVNCNIYEIGTDNIISPSLLPVNTSYSLSVFENGKAVKTDDTVAMTIDEFSLNNCQTEVKASITIPGFAPISINTGVFTPQKDAIYTLEVKQPDDFSLTIEQLKTNTDKITFIIKENGVAISKDVTETLDFNIDTLAPGTVIYEDDGSVSFTPQYKEPVTLIPTGDITVVGSIGGGVSKSTSFYLKPLKYTVVALSPDDNIIIRSSFSDSIKSVIFEIFADGEKLEKEAIEASNITYLMNEPYNKKLELEVGINGDGTISVSPKYDKYNWFAVYFIPTGELFITAECNGSEDNGTLIITNDVIQELIWNLIVPILILLFIIGSLIKKRFKYSSKIHYNYGLSVGTFVTGPRNGWNTESLMTWTAFIPFITDSKNVNGARFYAKGYMWNSTTICVKTAQYPEFSGTLDGGVDEQQSIRFNKNEIKIFEGEKKSNMIYENALVTSGDVNYRSCQIYLYSDN